MRGMMPFTLDQLEEESSLCCHVGPWKGETDFQNAAREAHEALCDRKSSLNPLLFAKWWVNGTKNSRERPTPWSCEASELRQKNTCGRAFHSCTL
jgi:hypothetical protein